MLTIRRWQFQTIFHGRERAWLAFVCKALEDTYPRSPLFRLAPGARLGKARDWCQRALANDLRADDEVMSFIFVMHEMSPGFDQHPTLRAVLDRRDEPPSARWARLFDA